MAVLVISDERNRTKLRSLWKSMNIPSISQEMMSVKGKLFDRTIFHLVKEVAVPLARLSRV
jgi:hypothetical protein